MSAPEAKVTLGGPRKAVIAIHGVGSPEPGTTVEAVVKLLTSTRSYSPFQETRLHIPLLPPKAIRQAADCLTPSEEFAAGQIRNFSGEDDFEYSTRLVSGSRSPDGSTVDVFEVHWGDLSHTKSFINGIAQSVLLPFRFMALGALAHRTTTPQLGRNFWKVAGAFYRLAQSMTTFVVPLLLVEVLLLIGIMTVAVAPLNILQWLGPIVFAFGISVITALAAFRTGISNSLAVFALLPICSGLVGGYAAMEFCRGQSGTANFVSYLNARHLVSVEILLLAWTAGEWLFSSLRQFKGRAFAQRSWRFICSANFLTCFIYFFRAWQESREGLSPEPPSGKFAFLAPLPLNHAEGVSRFALDSLQIALLVAVCIVVLLFLVTLAYIVCMSAAILRSPKGQKADLLRILRTMLLGASVTTAAVEISLSAMPWLIGLLPLAGLRSFFELVLHSGATGLSGVPIGAIAALFILICTSVLALSPSLMNEFRQSPNTTSDRLGSWLSNGLACFSLSAILAFILTSVFPTIWLVMAFAAEESMRASKVEVIAGYFSSDFWRLAMISLGALAFRASAVVSRVVKSVAGIALDIEVYLRDTPSKSTVRAVAFQRFLSLYAYVNDRKYDEIIFISHSQGTVILMDALRVVHRCAEHQPAVELNASSAKFVITMGSPLRQLYAVAFPGLFNWALDPNPASIGLSGWLNLYRSGDYVGRQLSRPDKSPGIYNNAVFAKPSGFFERCIGAGAHTHYWDSPDVALELDRAIAKSMSPVKAEAQEVGR